MITHKQLSLADIFTNCSGVFCFSFSCCHRQTPQASSLPNAEGSVTTAYFLNPNNIPADRIPEILPGTAGLLRV